MRQFGAPSSGQEGRHRQPGTRAAAQDRARAEEEDECPRAPTIRRGHCFARSSHFSPRAAGPARTDPPRLAAADMAEWPARDGVPEQAREFEAELARARGDGAAALTGAACRKFQLAAAEVIVKTATPVPGDDKAAALARIGPRPDVVDDLLSIGSVLWGGRCWRRWAAGFADFAGAWAIPRSPR